MHNSWKWLSPMQSVAESVTLRKCDQASTQSCIFNFFNVRKCDVINRGFSGYNARWCSHLLPQLVTKDVAKDAAVVTIFLGANDSNNFETNPRQHVPLEEFKERLTGMVQHLLVKLLKTSIMFISIFASLHIYIWSYADAYEHDWSF